MLSLGPRIGSLRRSLYPSPHFPLSAIEQSAFGPRLSFARSRWSVIIPTHNGVGSKYGMAPRCSSSVLQAAAATESSSSTSKVRKQRTRSSVQTATKAEVHRHVARFYSHSQSHIGFLIPARCQFHTVACSVHFI